MIPPKDTPAGTPFISYTDFAASIRKKFPGAYDNVPDAQLASAVINKYPTYAAHVSGTWQTTPTGRQWIPLDTVTAYHPGLWERFKEAFDRFTQTPGPSDERATPFQKELGSILSPLNLGLGLLTGGLGPIAEGASPAVQTGIQALSKAAAIGFGGLGAVGTAKSIPAVAEAIKNNDPEALKVNALALGLNAAAAFGGAHELFGGGTFGVDPEVRRAAQLLQHPSATAADIHAELNAPDSVWRSEHPLTQAIQKAVAPVPGARTPVQLDTLPEGSPATLEGLDAAQESLRARAAETADPQLQQGLLEQISRLDRVREDDAAARAMLGPTGPAEPDATGNPGDRPLYGFSQQPDTYPSDADAYAGIQQALKEHLKANPKVLTNLNPKVPPPDAQLAAFQGWMKNIGLAPEDVDGATLLLHATAASRGMTAGEYLNNYIKGFRIAADESEGSPEALYQTEPEGALYSRLLRGLEEKLPDHFSAAQLRQTVAKLGVKNEELERFNPVLADRLATASGPLDKAQVLNALREAGPKIEFQTAPDKYSAWTLRGRDSLNPTVTVAKDLTDETGYLDPHNLLSSGNPAYGYIAHTRQSDATLLKDAEEEPQPVNNVRLLEELQSDRHQAGAQYGYTTQKQIEEAYAERDRLGKAIDNALKQGNKNKYQQLEPLLTEAYARIYTLGNSALEAPFKTTWKELMLKRALLDAARDNKEYLAWTTGEQQAQRYGLSKPGMDLSVKKSSFLNGEPTWNIYYKDPHTDFSKVISVKGPNQLKTTLGPELASRVLASNKPVFVPGLHQLGGWGKLDFYDRQIPDTLAKLTKRWGVKPQDIEIQTEEGPTTVHAIRITPEMRADLQAESLPLFQGRKGKVEFDPRDGKALITAFKGADVSTVLHELAHVYRRTLSPEEDAAAREFVGLKPDEPWNRDAEETFARTYERYIAEGKAPNPALQSVFDRFSSFLRGLYGGVQSGVFNVPLGDGAKKLFDQLLTDKSTLANLTEQLRSLPSGEAPAARALQSAELLRNYGQALGEAGRTLSTIAENSVKWWNQMRTGAFTRTNVDDLIYGFEAARQRSTMHLNNFRQEIRRVVPDALRREAITNWIQAGGNEETLAARAAASSPRYAKGYQAALQLTPAEKAVAAAVKNYFDAMLQHAEDNDILIDGVENYVAQFWKRNNRATQTLKGELQRSRLSTTPFFTRHRVWQSYFEGEQAGAVPRTKDIGALLAAYDRSFQQVVAARGFIRSLYEQSASDGRPFTVVSGSGKRLPGTEDKPDAVILRPHTRPKNLSSDEDFLAGYGHVDHPALRRWKWVTTDPGSRTPYLMQGDLLVHPELLPRLKALLERSAFYKEGVLPAIGRGALKASRAIKQVLLSYSGVHQTNVGLRASIYGVSPFNPPPINPDDPLIVKGLEAGLLLAHPDGMQEFEEGVAASGAVNKLPLLGPTMQRYVEYLFNDYIPRLKADIFRKVYSANLRSYGGKLSDDQILKMSAQDANDAVGEQNWRAMGRHPTTQDVMSLLMLAPDFQESLLRMVGRAISPYGRQPFLAVAIRGGLGAYVAARIANLALDGNPHYDLPFQVKVGNKVLGVRLPSADIWHLMSDPHSFLYTRMNPTTVRTLVEMASQTNEFGQHRDAIQQLQDAVESTLPFLIQNSVKDRTRPLWESMLSGVGLSVTNYRSPAEKLANSFLNRSPVPTTEQSQRFAARNAAVDAYLTGNKQAISQALRAGKLAPIDLTYIREQLTLPPLARTVSRLTAPQALKVLQKATPAEWKILYPIVARKVAEPNTSLTPSQRARMMQAWRALSARH